MIELETVGCLFGHNSPAEKLFDRSDWWFELPGQFAWYRCPDCGLIYLNPRPVPNAMSHYYPQNYAAYRPAIEDERWALMRWKRRRNLQGKMKGVGQRAHRGRLLDVGCATGTYLAEMRKLSWQVQGVEPHEQAAKYARQRLNLDVFTGDLLASQLPDNYFDAVTLWDVLEHTHDPLAVLGEVHRLLKPAGLVAFSVPDPTSREAKRFGSAWIGYDTPRHLFLFGGTSLQRLIDEAGFEFLEDEHSLATYHTWVASWHTQLNTQLQPGPLRRSLIRIAYLPFWASLTSPYFNWLNRIGQGSVLTVYARAKKTP